MTNPTHIHLDGNNIILPTSITSKRMTMALPITPENVYQISAKYDDSLLDPAFVKQREQYRQALNHNSIALDLRKEVIRLQLKSDELNERACRKLKNTSVTWRRKLLRWEIPANASSFICWINFLESIFANDPSYQEMKHLLDEDELLASVSGSYPVRMLFITGKSRIRLSFDKQSLWFFFPYDADTVALMQHAGAIWQGSKKRWQLPADSEAIRLALELQTQGFHLDQRTREIVTGKAHLAPSEIISHENELFIQGAVDPVLLVKIRKDPRFSYDPQTGRWKFIPNRENAQMLLEAYINSITPEAKKQLDHYANTTDILEISSCNGTIIHEEEKAIPAEMTIIRGTSLGALCKKAGIDYRPVVSYGRRPYPKTLGIAIRTTDLESFNCISASKQSDSKSEIEAAYLKFMLNPLRYKLSIYVDATPSRWAVCVLNGSKKQIASQSGPVTVTPQTNNTAEYQALIKGLEWLQKHPCKEAIILSDSQVVLTQLSGGAVKTPHLLTLKTQTMELVNACRKQTKFTIRWTPGRRNRADKESRRLNSPFVLQQPRH